MSQRNVLKGLQIQRAISYRDPDALFALVGADGSGKNAYMPIGQSLLSHHMLLLGSPGAGKTNLLFHLLAGIRTNLTSEDVMVVFDPTGEYHRAFFQEGDIVFADDARAGDADSTNHWNLFAELCTEDRLVEDASMLCRLLFEGQLRSAADPFYVMAARDLMMALIVYLSRNGGAELQNNLALRELIDDFDMESMRQILDQETELRALSMYLQKPDSPKTIAIAAALQSAARELLQGRFRHEGTLGMRPLIRERGGKVVFVCYDAARSESLRPLYGALVDLCLQEVLSRTEAVGSVYLFMDGADVLPHLPHLEDAMLLGRSKGFKMILSSTGVSQMERRYGSEGGRSLLSAFGTTFTFLLRDRQSRNFVKSLYGRHRVVQTYNSSVQVRGTVEQVMDQYIIEDEDITALQPGECIVSPLHYPPFWFRAKVYEVG